MKPLISRLIIIGIALAAPFALSAQEANAQVRRPPQKGIQSLNQQDIAGFALGGPVGVLTDQQRESYVAAMKNERPKLAELQSKVLAARQEMLVASVSGKFDENAIRQKALVAARYEAEMAVIRAKVFSQVQPPLTPEQIEKVKAGTPGPMRPMGRQQLERPAQHAPTAGTNQDANGLPPKK
jgi:Spy/CpxP family protein refolding chaperone